MDLIWNENIKKIKNKLITTVGALMRINFILWKATRKYTMHRYYHVIYCITPLSQISVKNIRAISTIMNKAIRMLHGFYQRTLKTYMYQSIDYLNKK